MASVQRSATKAMEQLRELSLSQKLALGLGALLVAVSLMWLSQWAAAPELVPLLPGQSLAAEDLATVQAGLETLNVPSKVVGQQVLVPASQNRQLLLAQLGVQERLPADTSIGFDALVKEANPWISQEENNKRWTVALQTQLQRVLRQLQGVKDAYVFLNITGPRRGFSKNEPPASASITLIMQGGDPVSRQLALAAARIVSGAVRGLPLRNVEVVDANGVAALDWDSEIAGSSTLIDRLRREHEQRVAGKIRSQISFDPGVRVSVRVELDPTSRASESRLVTEGVETSRSTRNRTAVRPLGGGQPGVQPNVGVAAGSGASEERTTEEETESTTEPGTQVTTESTSAGEVKEIFAAINVSHRFLESIFRRQNPDADAPTEAQLEEVFKTQSAKIVNQVRKLVKPQDDEHVAVDWYYDETEPPAAEAGAATSATMELVQRYGPPSGLGLLALVAIGAMLRMARSTETGEAFGIEIGLPKEAIEAARRAARDVHEASRAASNRAAAAATAAATPADGAAVIPAPIGEAAEGMLEATEVDPAAVQTKGMLEQVAKIVESDAESIATLLDQWTDGSR